MLNKILKYFKETFIIMKYLIKYYFEDFMTKSYFTETEYLLAMTDEDVIEEVYEAAKYLEENNIKKIRLCLFAINNFDKEKAAEVCDWFGLQANL